MAVVVSRRTRILQRVYGVLMLLFFASLILHDESKGTASHVGRILGEIVIGPYLIAVGWYLISARRDRRADPAAGSSRLSPF